MTATIEQIFSAASHGEPQLDRAQAQLVTDVGLDGDRYAGTGVISLIEAEAVEAFNAATGLTVNPAETGRNIVTRGIELNSLVGKQFRIGEVELEGTELCDPCATLGKNLATDQVSAAQIVRAFTDSAGIRARVLSAGQISPGTTISK
jgi:MOSC domain-containing protein YiiM